MAGFGQLDRAATTEGTLSAKHKELMALAIEITSLAPGRIGFHVAALTSCTARVPNSKKRGRCAFMGAAVRRLSMRLKPSPPGKTCRRLKCPWNVGGYLARVPSSAAPTIIPAARPMLQLRARPLTSINRTVEPSGVR